MKKSLFLIALMASITSFAQTHYALSTYHAAYTELINPAIINSYVDDVETWDDPLYTLSFGFDFEIGAEIYTSITQFGEGAYMAFGDPINLEDTVHIFGLQEDLIDGAYLEGLASSQISFKTVGTAGNRIAKIQYQNAAFYNEVTSTEPAADNRMSFQLWFYENGGIMEIHYGNSNLPSPELAFSGNQGPIMVVGLNVSLQTVGVEYGASIIGDPTNPTLFEFTTIPEGEYQMGLDGMPESGRVYRLAPAYPVGIFEAKAEKFSVYPTITESNLWIKGETNANTEYRIMDITGKEILIGKIQNQNPINVSNLNPGVYLFSINGMGNAAKFIKQ